MTHGALTHAPWLRILALSIGAAVPAAPALAQCPDGTPPPCRAAPVQGAVDQLNLALDADTSTVLHLFAQSVATDLRGLALLSRGDGAGARRALSSVRAILPYGRSPSNLFPDVQQWASLSLARLDLAAGDLASADRRLDYGTFANGEGPLRGEMEELRGQIAERRGDLPAARAAYARVISIWQHADPERHPRVAAARAALGRLGTR